jgi:hypothetical protein
VLPESWEVLIAAFILSMPLAPGLMIAFRMSPVEAYQAALVLSGVVCALVQHVSTPREQRE